MNWRMRSWNITSDEAMDYFGGLSTSEKVRYFSNCEMLLFLVGEAYPELKSYLMGPASAFAFGPVVGAKTRRIGAV
jgi:hypothetical protein